MGKDESLFSAIERNLLEEFSGKLNLLDLESKQFLGVACILRGQLWSFQYRRSKGIEGMFLAYAHAKQGQSFAFITEHERVHEDRRDVFDSFHTVRAKVIDHYNNFKRFQRLRPPNHLHVKIDSYRLKQRGKLNTAERELLKIIARYPKIEDIYRNSQEAEFRVTQTLIEFRQAGLLTVQETQKRKKRENTKTQPR